MIANLLRLICVENILLATHVFPLAVVVSTKQNMSLASIWQNFQASPQIQHLSDDATLSYITTCQRFTGPRQIVDQMAQNKTGSQSQDQSIAVHEGSDSIVIEGITTMKFDFNGQLNPFLPGMDDNLCSGKMVEMPIVTCSREQNFFLKIQVYTVTFCENRKIRAIRVFWDQATVLKQVDVIGTRGRGWPVKDGRDQVRMLQGVPVPSGRVIASSAHTQNPTHDPHASLHLFEPPKQEPRQEYAPVEYNQRVTQERRDYGELFTNEESARPDPVTSRTGTGPQRLVSVGSQFKEPEQEQNLGNRYGASNAANNNHFELGSPDISELSTSEQASRAGNVRGPTQDRDQHFSFGTPDAATLASDRDENDRHRKGGIRDHNASNENYYGPNTGAKQRPDLQSSFDMFSGSPTVAEHTNQGRRGPPQPSFNAFNEQASFDNPHGMEYNRGRRGPPSQSYDFTSGEVAAQSGPHVTETRGARPDAYTQTETRYEAENPHNMEYNRGRRGPPASQYDFTAPEQTTPYQPTMTRRDISSQYEFGGSSERQDVHGHEFIVKPDFFYRYR